ncbi:MAG TPA: hypothetical protein VF892_08955 [Pseudonocardiaceae bacterium]
MGGQSAELPSGLRHQMDDWSDQVREQQLGFLEAADDLDERAAEIQARLAAADAAGRPTEGLRNELRWVSDLAASARTISRVPFLIPDEGVAVREDPAGPDGLAYADPTEVTPRSTADTPADDT